MKSPYLRKKRDNLALILRALEDPEAARDGAFAGKPALLWLESTARCNLRCKKCGHAFDPPGSLRTLPRDLPTAVIEDADPYFEAAVKVRTSGYGEMFLFQGLRSLIDRVKRYGCWTEGTTNGLLIDSGKVEWLVATGYDQLVFSIDGVEPETMKRLRGADLQRIWSALGEIQARKRETGSSKPQVVVGFVAEAGNLEELPELVRRLAELDVSFLAITTLHYRKFVPGSIDAYGELYHLGSLANLDRVRVEELLAETKRAAARVGIGCGVYFDLDRIYRDAVEGGDNEEGDGCDPAPDALPRPPLPAAGSRPLAPFYCVYPWTSLFVAARGTTKVCCSMRGDIGTVAEAGDLDRAWNGETLRAIRRSISRGEVHPNCEYCVSRDRHLGSFIDLDDVRSALSLMFDPDSPGEGPLPDPPAERLLGFFDVVVVEARSRDRVRLSGWAGSWQDGAPVREVNLKMGDRPLAVVTTFHDRPDVAAHYRRQDLLRSGWQVLVTLPELEPGEYALTAEATDASGFPGPIGTASLRVIP